MPTHGGNNANKRVRIDPGSTAGNNTSSQPPGKKTSPSAAAKAALDILSESHHPDLASIILPYGRTIQSLRHRAINKRNILRKMEEEDDLVPKSIKLKIELIFAKDAIKKIPQERKTTLETELATAITAFQTTAKQTIIKAAQEELKAFHATIIDETVDLIHDTTDAFIAEQGITGCTVHDKAWNIIHHYRSSLFVHHKQEVGLVEMIQTRYIDQYKLDEQLPELIELPDLTIQYDTPQAQATARAEYKTNSNTPQLKGHLKLKRILEDTLVVPYSQYLHQLDENQRQLALKQRMIALREGPATEATMMEIDQEMPADRQTLQTMIDNAVHQKTKKLELEVSQLKKAAAKPQSHTQPRGQTQQRGRTKPGASPKKKSGNQKQQQQQPNNRKQNQRRRSNSRSRESSVGSRSNASGQGQPNRRTNNSSGRSKGKNNTSNNRRGKR